MAGPITGMEGSGPLPNSDARHAAHRAFEAFEGSSPESFCATRDEYDALPYLRFDDAAQEVFAEWRADLERRLRGGDLSPALESHLSKYRKLVPGLALINHLADGGGASVSEAATLRALALAEYLEAHARRAYAAGSEAEARRRKPSLRGSARAKSRTASRFATFTKRAGRT